MLRPMQLCLRHSGLAWALLSGLAATSPSAQPEDSRPSQASPQEASTERAPLAARGRELELTLPELEPVLLDRFAMAEQGREILDLLLKARLLEVLAREAGIEVTNGDVNERWAKLDRQAKLSDPRGIAGQLEDSGLAPEEFREFLRLAIVQERLTRRAMELEPDVPVSGDQQEVWLKQEMDQRGLELPPPPWSEGFVARCGNVEIGVDEFGAFLRQRLEREAVRDTAWHMLLEKGLRKRMPDLSSEAIAAGIEAEIERRRRKHMLEHPGISFEQRLGAAGRTLETLQGDPSVLVATLTRLWVDRSGPEGLREAFEAERGFFEGRFGRAVRAHMLFLIAGKFVNDLVPRSFEEAERQLVEYRGRIGNREDFEALAGTYSEEPRSRNERGALGWVTSGDPRVPETIRAALFDFVDTGNRVPAEGTAVGPVRLESGSALLWVSEVRPSPTWEVMSERVHEELRRRLVEDILTPEQVELLF